MNKPANTRKVTVAVPAPEEERTRYTHVGVIAVLGFVVGVSWPFLAGVQLVPSAPGDETPPQDSEQTTQTAAPNSSAAPPQVSSKPSVQVEKSVVISCLDDKGRKQSRCDKPDFDRALKEHMEGLAACKPGAQGTFSLGLKVDFSKNKVVDFLRGKSTTVDKDVAAELMACAKAALGEVSLAGVDHLHETYLVFFFLTFQPAGTPIAELGAEAQALAVIPASGSATIVFESAMVRDKAETDAAVLTRLLYGTRVFVTGRIGEWYEVKYDSKGRKGFIHKNALGME
jgi:hypothetical protein